MTGRSSNDSSAGHTDASRRTCAALSPVEFAILVLAGLAGGAVQSVLGFGAAVMTVPALAVIEPELLPAASLFAMAPLIATMAWRGRHDIDRTGARRIIVGRLPGVGVGTWLVTILDKRSLTIFVAVILLAAVTSMSRGWSVPITPRNQALAGFTSGVTGTSTGLGGPPLALLYRVATGPAMRATLAVAFMFGVVISLTSLAIFDEVTLRHAQIGLPMGFGAVLGLQLARPLVARLKTETLRTGVLLWAGVGALVAIVRAASG